MSLVDDKRVHRKKEIALDKKTNLFLSDDLINKIDVMHKKVPSGLEWSGILVYKTLEGNIGDHENWKIEAVDLIPMDIGTSGYTEYDYDATDEYSFDRLTSYMEQGFKLGHIHTHHNMGCFFSGTDTSELHDNSPNYNYYLSLIVNYKDISAWCAKIAFCATETTTGSATKSVTYNGEQVHLSNSEEQIEIEQTSEIMYTINMEISKSNQLNVDEEFVDRIDDLDVKRLAALRSKVTHYTPNSTVTAPASQGTSVGRTWSREEADEWDEKKKPSTTKSKRSRKDKNTKEETNLDKFNVIFDPKKELIFDKLKVIPFLKMWLLEKQTFPGARNHLMVSLGNIIDIVAVNTIIKSQKDSFMDTLMETFEELAESYFIIDKMGPIDYHCLSVAIYEILEDYKYTSCITLIREILEVYILEDVSTTVCKYYTNVSKSYTDYFDFSEEDDDEEFKNLVQEVKDNDDPLEYWTQQWD